MNTMGGKYARVYIKHFIKMRVLLYMMYSLSHTQTHIVMV